MTGAATGSAAVPPGVAPRRRWRHAGASPCGAAVWGGRARPRGRRASRRGARAGEAGQRRQPRPWTLGRRRGSPSRPGAARGGSSGGDGRLARGGSLSVPTSRSVRSARRRHREAVLPSRLETPCRGEGGVEVDRHARQPQAADPPGTLDGHRLPPAHEPCHAPCDSEGGEQRWRAAERDHRSR